ncbi:ribonucleoside-diphosphate reductase subunit alpha [bacterium]|nr:MAG: ribonucleoside-diphosphate reductase subunit alpha [bacterium]
MSTSTVTTAALSAEWRGHLFDAGAGLLDVHIATLCDEISLQLPPNADDSVLFKASLAAARSRIEIEPNYSFVAARVLLLQLAREVSGQNELTLNQIGDLYRRELRRSLERGVQAGVLDAAVLEFDLEKLADALRPERDWNWTFLGLQTLYDRYFVQDQDGNRLELPQIFWMRVAIGLSLQEDNPTARAIEFYEVLSQKLFVSATPTLFHAATKHPQLSSCYLTTVPDDLGGIFKCLQDNALLSKWAGGLGNDWTNVRALGAKIKGTGGISQGIVPFLKVANDAAVAVNQGGRRKGAVCAYVESWHLDIEEFLELRKNTGDERRRTHDMNTANWIPDLFMQRVAQNGQWTLFSPDETPDLHDLYGVTFKQKYEEYERRADAGEIKAWKRVEAVTLWRRMLSMVFETGHPWITFKDPCNLRSPQDHVGTVHNSNLCTEITLNNSAEETAVCNLGSINLTAYIDNGTFDRELLAQTVKTALRMLDNVVDLNYYPTIEAKRANQRHRPVGLGIMGFQDALYQLGISYGSDEAMQWADQTQELISFHAILSSTGLAKERGAYQTFKGSKWERGLLPLDTIEILEAERGDKIEVDRSSHLDWKPVREAILEHGMRNSNVMAIAPTATISNIAGCSQSIEPAYKNLFVKSNLSGEFTQINEYLVRDLKKLGLWDEHMRSELKYHDGSVQTISRVPDALKTRYKTAFEIEPEWILEAGARRQKWIDMGQSLNLYMSAPSGKKLDEMYFTAWRMGLKTTYYLRTLAATQVEKSTLDVNRFGVQPKWMKSESASSQIQVDRAASADPIACTLGAECEACQ